MPKVVIDANVILSGVLFGGTPAILLKAIQDQKFSLCMSQELYEEVMDKLTIKFLVDKNILLRVATLLNNGIMYAPIATVRFPQDPDDAYLLSLAETCTADYLVTGDKKHLLPLKKWKSTKIISSVQAKEILI